MQDIISMMQALAPDLNQALSKRMLILEKLEAKVHPIGRKALAQEVFLSERSLRTVIDLMKEQGIVEVSKAGIALSPHGKGVAKLFSRLQETTLRRMDLEQELMKQLPIQSCWVVPGDLEKDEKVYDLLSLAVQALMQTYLKIGSATVAVTGGETLAHIGSGFTPKLSVDRELIFVPARGGVGGGFHIQSDMVGGVMAQQAGARYVPFFVPDLVEEQTSRILKSDPAVQQAVTLSKKADCLLASVGTADTMAQRRDLTKQQQVLLKNRQAIGEAFGVFFDQFGQEVLHLSSMGIQLEDVESIPLVLMVVGGASKAAAVKGYCQLVPNHGWLICDEGLANMILNEATH